MKPLTDWIDSNYGEHYDLAETQFQNGCVSAKTIPYLIRPTDILISHKNGLMEATFAANWLVPDEFVEKRDPNKNKTHHTYNRESDTRQTYKRCSSTRFWETRVRFYRYNGEFKEHSESMKFSNEFEDWNSQVPIQSLPAYPLQYAAEGTEARLADRGRMFWSCRLKRLAEYPDEIDQGSFDVSTTYNDSAAE